MKTSIKSLFATALVAFSVATVSAAPVLHEWLLRPLLIFSVATVSAAPANEDPKAPVKASYAINIFKSQENKVNFLLEKVKGKKLTITLRNAKGESLFSENLAKNTEGYARRFDMSSLTDGIYTIEVTDGETIQKKEINLNTEQPARLVVIK
ncbi:MAG: hypothetical protein QM669_07910 [Siphonobacter sp.]